MNERFENHRRHLTSQMADALGLDPGTSMADIDHQSAAALGLGEQSLSAKRYAIRNELYRLAASGTKPADLRSAIESSPVGQQIRKAMGDPGCGCQDPA